MKKRPNFLLFITDQQRYDHLEYMGNPLLRTPHLDATTFVHQLHGTGYKTVLIGKSHLKNFLDIKSRYSPSPQLNNYAQLSIDSPLHCTGR